jgi:hypothetical protein
MGTSESYTRETCTSINEMDRFSRMRPVHGEASTFTARDWSQIPNTAYGTRLNTKPLFGIF